jgi:isocitrate dehydrogenase
LRRQQATAGEPLQLMMVTNRGVKVFPEGHPETCCTDHWRCRFVREDRGPNEHRQVLSLLHRLEQAGFDFIKTEHLYLFDGLPGYSLGQGE